MKNYLFFTFIFIFLLTLSVSVFSQIYIVKDLEDNFILATDQITQLNEYQNPDYQVIVLEESGSTSKLNLKKLDTQPPPTTHETPDKVKSIIEIVDWTNRISISGNYYHVEGILKNTSSEVATYVRVKVQAFDKDNNLVSIHEGYADPVNLSPKQDATFSIMVNYNSNIDSFKLQVIWN